MYCPACGAQTEPIDRFCLKCGAPQPQPAKSLVPPQSRVLSSPLLWPWLTGLAVVFVLGALIWVIFRQTTPGKGEYRDTTLPTMATVAMIQTSLTESPLPSIQSSPPTPTTRPRPTAIAIPTAKPPPTATPRPISTPVPPTATLPPPPTVPPTAPQRTLCTLNPSETFDSLWQAEQSRLGCARNEVQVFTAEQPFERGFMFWREDTRQIYVLVSGGTWQVFPDTWTPDQPQYSCPDVAPSQSPPTPLHGFGKVWCEQLGGPNAAVGWATHQELGFPDDRWVDYEHGTMLWSAQWSGQRGIFVLYADGTWQLKR